MSIKQFGGQFVAKVVIVDNDSTDGSLKLAEQIGGPALTVIRNAENAGFARACNQGAKIAATRFLLFLNPDARLLDSTVARACEYLESSSGSRVGILGAQLVDASNQVSRSCSRHPTALAIVARSLGADRLFRGQSHFLSDWDHSATRIVEQVIGACYFVRTDVFVQLGGFDEDFFVYFEEVDFAVRASRWGWRTVYCADSVAYHLGGGTSRQAKPQRLFYSLRSRILYARKHFGALGYSAVIVTTLALEPCTRLLAAAIQRDRAVAAETLGGYRLLWRWFFDRQHPKPSTLRSPAHSSSDLLG
jgi:GT2 family glycosyltransferase